MKKFILSIGILMCFFSFTKGQNIVGNGGFETHTFIPGNIMYVDPVNVNWTDYLTCWGFGCPFNNVNTFPPNSPPSSTSNAATIVSSTTTAPHSGDFCASMYRTYNTNPGPNSRNQPLRYEHHCTKGTGVFQPGEYKLTYFIKGIAWCPQVDDGKGFFINNRLMADADCQGTVKVIGSAPIPITPNWTEVSFCFEVTAAEANTFNEMEFYITHPNPGFAEQHVLMYLDDVSIIELGDAPDISFLNGNVCASDAIIEVGAGIDYAIEIEKAFEGVVCTVSGTGPATIDLFDECNITCGLGNCYQVSLTYERCGVSCKLTAQPHFICGPPANAIANPAVICVGASTTLYATGCQPTNYTYEWFNSLTPGTPLGTGCTQSVTPTIGGGSFYLTVTDPITGCSTDDQPIIGWKLCDDEREKKKLARLAKGEALDIDLYPNPANSHFLVTAPTDLTESVSLQMIDAAGRLVKEESFDFTTSPLQINTSDLATGIYLVKIAIDGKAVKYEKMIIKH